VYLVTCPLPVITKPIKIHGRSTRYSSARLRGFWRQDIPALLKLVADEVDWKEICPASLPYAGLRENPAEVGEFFSDITKAEDISVFEPQEFIGADEGYGLSKSRSIPVERTGPFA
jgi:hypothetical protein